MGSFIATLVLRWPKDDNLSGRSRCDGCGTALGALHLVPIASHLIQRGRCATCGAPINRFHLHVELAAALMGAGAMVLLPPTEGILLAAFGWLLLPLLLLDVRHLWLPDRLTALLAVTGLALAGEANDVALMDRALGALVGFASLWTIARLYRALRQRDGMGSGDPKIFGAIGCWIGWQALPLALLAGSAGLLAILLFTGRARDAAAQHPLGAGLAVGAWLVFAIQLLA